MAAEVSYNSAWYTLSGLLSKNTVTTKEYTPFGELLTEDVSGFGYRGEYYSAETGAVYLRARYYEPELGRFNQKDILRGDISVPVSLNRYAYVRNDPVNFVDPSGMRYEQHAGVGGGTKKASKPSGSYLGSGSYYSNLSQAREYVSQAYNNYSAAKRAYERAQAKAPGSDAAYQAKRAMEEAEYYYNNAKKLQGTVQNASNQAAAQSALSALRRAVSDSCNAASKASSWADKATGAKKSNAPAPTSPSVSSPEREMSCDPLKTVYSRKIDSTLEFIAFIGVSLIPIAVSLNLAALVLAGIIASTSVTMGAAIIAATTTMAAIFEAGISLVSSLTTLVIGIGTYVEKGEIEVSIVVPGSDAKVPDILKWLIIGFVEIN